MTKWKKELKLIDNLGLLYPKIRYWPEYDKYWDNERKAYWVYDLCVYQLDQQIPQLEHYIRNHLYEYWWKRYKEYLKINEKRNRID